MAVLALVMAAIGAGAQGAALTERLDPSLGRADADRSVVWYDARALGIEGQGWGDLAQPYSRLPAHARGVAPDAVWALSRHSAGVCVRFVTDSPSVSARWTLQSDRLAMNHMPATGVSGLDLYARDSSGGWRWVGVGRPEGRVTEDVLLHGTPGGLQEYLLYLPLYNGVDSLEIGISPGAALGRAPGYPRHRAKPVVMYGTSIVQGASASRPGMAHSAIIGRALDRPVINLGFSGSGKMEVVLASLLAEIEAAAYVIDCAPNMTAELIAERAADFVRVLRANAEGVPPIILVENIAYQHAWFSPATRENYLAKNTALRAAFDTLRLEGVAGLVYVRADHLLGNDHEATVDGTHPTDIGFTRMAAVLAPVIREALEE
jgi:hypothetical protein